MWPVRSKKLNQQREAIREICKMVSPFSKDIPLLQEHHRILIFVYDDMMQGKRNSDLIVETSVTGRYPLANCYTEDNFHCWKKELGKLSFPIALDKPVSGFTRFDATPAKIWGELYAIRPTQFIKLDIEKENGVQFTRRRVKVILPYTHWNPIPDRKETIIEPMMYVGNHDYWDDQLGGIHSSRPVEKTPDERAWLGAHYRFK